MTLESVPWEGGGGEKLISQLFKTIIIILKNNKQSYVYFAQYTKSYISRKAALNISPKVFPPTSKSYPG